MTIGHALTFIKRGMTDAALRDRLNDAVTYAELQSVLDVEGLSFSPDEFEDAANSTLIKLPSWEASDELREFKLWWELLQKMMLPDGCRPAGDCTGNACGGCRGH